MIKDLIVTIDTARLKAKLAALAGRAKKPEKILAWAGRFMARDVRGVFSEFQTRGRGTWPALKLRKGEPLRDTRTLERAIGWKVIGNDVFVGTNLRYAKTHQRGMTIRAKTSKGLLFIGPNAGATLGQQRRGNSIRRTRRMPASGKLPKGLRWYKLMSVTIPRRRFLIWRRDQLKLFLDRAKKYVVTGEMPGGPAPLSGGNPNGSGKLRRRTFK